MLDGLKQATLTSLKQMLNNLVQANMAEVKLTFIQGTSLLTLFRPGPEVIKNFMLNSAEYEYFPAHKCKNANYCWHFNIYEQEK